MVQYLAGDIFPWPFRPLASWRQVAVQHFKQTSMHLWQAGCTGNLMTEHAIPWNGGLLLFSAAGLLPLLNLARQFLGFTSPACLLTIYMLSRWWSKINMLVTLKLGPAHTLGIVMIFLWTLSPYIYAKLDTIWRRQKCQPGGMGSKGVNPPELTKFDALKLDMAEKQFNSISSLSHATFAKLQIADW